MAGGGAFDGAGPGAGGGGAAAAGCCGRLRCKRVITVQYYFNEFQRTGKIGTDRFVVVRIDLLVRIDL